MTSCKVGAEPLILRDSKDEARVTGMFTRRSTVLRVPQHERVGLIIFMLLAQTALAAPRHSGAEILRDVRKLSVVGTALYVAAHPDDENTRLLATLANENQVRTAYLALTRGEGGQNLIGPEIGPLLGMIRTQELLAARRIDGAEQYFTRARDFGFSKSVDETLSIWNHDQVLSDAVWVIRTLKPDVIITRFPQEAGDTHGHHTASARIALEAFTAAADPTFHPEQLAHTTVWQAKRIVWNAWSRDPGEKAFATKPMTMNSSVFSPLLGLSYGEMAADSRSMHKSQGFGAAPVHGPSPEQFVWLAGAAGATVFEGIDLSWKRVAGSEKLAALLSKASAEYKVDRPAASIPTLLLALDAMRALPQNPYTAQKLKELTEVIVDCAGLFLEATSADFTVNPGSTVEVTATALARSSTPVALKGVALVEGVANTQKLTLKVPAEASLSNPAWLEAPPEKGTWVVTDQLKIGVPESGPALTVDFALTFGANALTVTRPVAYKWTDPTAGERFRPLEVLPPVVVKASAPVMMFEAALAKPLRVTVKSTADNQAGTIELQLPSGWAADKPSQPFSLAKKGAEAELTFSIKPGPANGSVLVNVKIGNASYSRGLTRIDYPHIPMQTMLPVAEVKLIRLALVKGKTKLGYLAGAGDDVAESLRQVGYEVTNLTDETVRTKPLTGFDAIVIGIRAYNVNPRMPSVYQPLMKYVSDGGTLVVQYNTKNWLSNVPAEMGPYPFEVSQDRVTDENAAVTFELPKHHVLTTPNALSAADFEGWVQERGLYFAGNFDGRYETPLSMHDSGEAPKKGALIVAKHGKGTFIYTGLAFFRQLPAGVPGAYRLFANLLAHGT